MAVFGKTIYAQGFASYSTWVGHEPSSRPHQTAGLVFAYKHTWWKGWVYRALHYFSKTGFWEVSEVVWPSSEESVIKITASFQTSSLKTTFNGLPHCSSWLSRAWQAAWLVDLLTRSGGHQPNQTPQERSNSCSRAELAWHKARAKQGCKGSTKLCTSSPRRWPLTESHQLVHGDISCVNVTQGFWAKSAPATSMHHFPILCHHRLFYPVQIQWLIK